MNDTHGHRTGDRILHGLADLMRARARAADQVARYGGEEFALLLPATGREAAKAFAEQLRTNVASAPLPVPITISVGVASTEGLPDDMAPESLTEAADAALYEAKRLGRNTVHVHQEHRLGG